MEREALVADVYLVLGKEVKNPKFIPFPKIQELVEYSNKVAKECDDTISEIETAIDKVESTLSALKQKKRLAVAKKQGNTRSTTFEVGKIILDLYKIDCLR